MLMLNGKSIAHATSCSQSVTTQVTEVATKDYGDFSSKEPQKIDWQITSDHLLTETGWIQLQKAQRDMTPVVAYFCEASNYTAEGCGDGSYYTGPKSTAPYTYGEAIISSLNITAAAGDNATMSVTLDGRGPLYFSYTV